MKPIFQWVRDRLKKPDVEPNPPKDASKVIEDGKTKGEVKSVEFGELKVEKHVPGVSAVREEKTTPDHLVVHELHEVSASAEHSNEPNKHNAVKLNHNSSAQIIHPNVENHDINKKTKKKLELPLLDVKFYLLDSQDVADKIVMEFDTKHSLIFIDARPMEAREPMYLKTAVSKLKRDAENQGSIHAYGEGWLIMVPRHIILEKRKPKVEGQ